MNASRPSRPVDPHFDRDEISTNPSTEPQINRVIAGALNRREALLGIAAGVAAATALGVESGEAAEAKLKKTGGRPTSTFPEIHHDYPQGSIVPSGYEPQVLVRWGDPVLPDAPAFDAHQLSAAAQEKQFGYNNDYVAFLPLPFGSQNSDRGLLCVNHEYTNPWLMFTGLTEKNWQAEINRDQCDIEMASMGHSVLEIQRTQQGWRVVQNSPYARRISARSTPIKISGPAAGHARLRTAADPTGTVVIGTLNNCAGGVTPWGTVLIAEENFNLYFGGDFTKTTEAANYERYGIRDSKYAARWFKYFDRFHIEREPNEPNRFGWMVEFDPYDPQSVPVKRTALGRFKHEGATCVLSANGHVVVYSGDDQANEFLFKFVSHGKVAPHDRSLNRDLLDDGTLYVARFYDDGRLQWLPLVHGTGLLTAENGFSSQADVLINPRYAGTLIGATPLDRPEDVEVSPRTGHIYLMLTNNKERMPDQVDAANPRPKDLQGHILELIQPLAHGAVDHAATEARWQIFLLAGDPRNTEHQACYHPQTTDSGWLSCPDNAAFDSQGRLWISTDGAYDAAKIGDALYCCDTDGPARALTRQFYCAPRGSEVCGPCFTPDDRTVFLAIQHPGDDSEVDSSFDEPSTRWPDFSPDAPPRPSVIAIWRRDQGKIGT